MYKLLLSASVILICSIGLQAQTEQVLPLNFEDTTVNHEIFGFGDASFNAIPAEIIDNPDMAGVNMSTRVISMTKTDGAQEWAGASLPLAETIDLSEGSVFVVKVWSPRADVPIQLKFEDTNSPDDANGNPSIIAEVIVNTTVAQEWEVLSFDMSLDAANYSASHTYNQVVLFPNFGNMGSGDETFYLDDILNPNATSISKELASQIQMNVFPNPAVAQTKVAFDLPVTAETSLTLVNMLGQHMVKSDLGTLPAGEHTHEIAVNNLSAGIYYVLLSVEGQVVRHSELMITE